MARIKKQEETTIAPGSDALDVGKELKKKYGELHVRMGSEVPDLARPENRLETGIVSIDDILFGGMIFGGDPIQIYGANNLGKTTFAMNIAANVQHRYKQAVAWMSVENFDYRWGRVARMSYDDGAFQVFRHPKHEILLDMSFEVIASGAFGLVVVD